MIKNLPPKTQQAFHDNLKDWCLGGPKENGWTRTGLPVVFPPVRLVNYTYDKILVNDCLAKNRAETQRWHINFLETLVDVGKSKFNWNKTSYYWEYLKPRYSDKDGYARAKSFISLFEDVLDHGIQKPVKVVDLELLDMKFKYFRFDGCHRLCCSKVIGEETIPALIFKAEICDWSDLSAQHIFPDKHNLPQNTDSFLQQRHLL